MHIHSSHVTSPQEVEMPFFIFVLAGFAGGLLVAAGSLILGWAIIIGCVLGLIFEMT
jgi:hypothetical protein